MEMLNRYLQAVGQYLPAETKDDTLEELRANLLEQMDVLAEELERPLTEGEVAAILKAHGKPEVVAVRYLPQRSLIGPAIYPFYLFTLKRALPWVILIYGVVRGVELALSPKGVNVGLSVVELILQLAPVLLAFWAIVTLVFVLVERGQRRLARDQPLAEWDPERLPRVAVDVVKPTRANRVADMVGQWFALAYLLAVPHYPYLILGPGGIFLSHAGVMPSESWMQFYWWLVGGMALQLVLRMVNLGRTPRVWVNLWVKLVGVVVLAMVVAARVYFTAKSDLVAAGLLNLGFNVGFQIALAISLVDLGWSVWKALRGEVVLRAGVKHPF